MNFAADQQHEFVCQTVLAVLTFEGPERPKESKMKKDFILAVSYLSFSHNLLCLTRNFATKEMQHGEIRVNGTKSTVCTLELTVLTYCLDNKSLCHLKLLAPSILQMNFAVPFSGVNMHFGGR